MTFFLVVFLVLALWVLTCGLINHLVNVLPEDDSTGGR